MSWRGGKLRANSLAQVFRRLELRSAQYAALLRPTRCCIPAELQADTIHLARSRPAIFELAAGRARKGRVFRRVRRRSAQYAALLRPTGCVDREGTGDLFVRRCTGAV